MQRVTITLDDDLMGELDQLIAVGGYRNRSEAIRDLARAGMQQVLLDTGRAEHCVAALIYVSDHTVRDLARRLAALYHEDHDIAVVTTHIQLSHESALEVAMLNGAIARVRNLAEKVQGQRGVRHGRLVIVPANVDEKPHRHDGPDGERHVHIRAR